METGIRNGAGHPADPVTVPAGMSAKAASQPGPLLTEIRRQRLLEFALTAVAGKDLDLLAEQALLMTADALRVDRCHLMRQISDARGIALHIVKGWREARTDEAADFDHPGCADKAIPFWSGPLVVADLRSESPIRFSPTIMEAGLSSGACVPIVLGNGWIRVLGAFSVTPRVFATDEIQFLQSVAHVLVQAFERKRIERVSQREEDEQDVIAEIGKVIGSSLLIDEVYERFAQLVKRLVPWDRITIATVDADKGTAELAFEAGVPLPGYSTGIEFPLFDTPAYEATARRVGLIFTGSVLPGLLGRYPVLRPVLDAGFRSMLAVPLIWRDRGIAILSLKSMDPVAYTDRELSVATRIGAQIASAIANSKVYEELKGQLHERAVLAEIGRIVGSSLNVDDVHRLLAEQVRRLLRFDRMEIGTIDSGRGTITQRSVIGESRADVTLGIPKSLSGTVGEHVLRTRSGLIRSSAPSSRDSSVGSSKPASADAEQGSLICVPLLVRDEVIGLLTVHSDRPDAYGDRELALAQRIAAQIAGPIANAELHGTLQRESSERAFLAQFGQFARPGMELQDLCKQAAARILRVIPFDAVSISLLDLEAGTELEVYSDGFAHGGHDGTARRPLTGSLTGEAVRARRGLMVGNSSGAAVASLALPNNGTTHDGMRAGIVIPLVLHNEPIGALQIWAKTSLAYDDRDLGLAERIGEQLARVMVLCRPSPPAGESTGIGAQSWATPRAQDHPWAWGAASPGGALRRSSETTFHGPISAVIVDRQSLCRRGLAALFRSTTVKVAGDAAEVAQVAEIVRRTSPSVVLHEVHFQDMSDLDALWDLRLDLQGIRVVVLAENAQAAHVRAALRAGASAFLLKTVSPAGLVNAMERVVAGGTVIEPDLLSGLLADLTVNRLGPTESDRVLVGKMTERDKAILTALAAGKSNQEISLALNLTTGTIRNRLIQIYKLIGARDRASAVYIAARSGILR